jgi:hypothetical protein
LAGFQRRDGVTRRGLREIQPPRASVTFLPLGGGDEDAKLFEGHVKPHSI